MMRGNSAFGLPLAFNSTQGKSTTGGAHTIWPNICNYKPHYAQSLASLLFRTPTGCFRDQKLVLWKLRENECSTGPALLPMNWSDIIVLLGSAGTWVHAQYSSWLITGTFWTQDGNHGPSQAPAELGRMCCPTLYLIFFLGVFM